MEKQYSLDFSPDFSKNMGNTENMSSKKAEKIEKKVKEIEKEVKKIHTDEIWDLLKNYNKSERDIIQKYAETKIAVQSKKGADLAYFGALILFVASIGVNSIMNASHHTTTESFVSWMIFIFALLIFLSYLFIKTLIEKEPLQDIIIAIEDVNKLKAHEQESLILSNINKISNELKSINSRIDILEKTVIEKTDIIAKEVTNLKKLEEP
jgi:hypothetical protein